VIGRATTALSVGQDPPVTIPLPGSDPTTTEPGSDETTTTIEAGGDETTTTTTPESGDDSGGGVVTFPGDASVTLPSGWKFVEAADGYALLTTDGAATYIGVYNTDDTITSDQLVAQELQVRSDSLTDVQTTDVQAIPLNAAHVTGASGQVFNAILPSQSGSTAVEGDFFGITTDLDYGYTVTDLTQKGSYDPHEQEFSAIIQSLIDSLAAQ
jgi:hypothetical protein